MIFSKTMRKTYLLFLLLLIAVNCLLSDVNLTRFGRIDNKKQDADAEFFYEKNEYYILIDGQNLIGNSLFLTHDGYLTLTGEHENIPTWLRLYDVDGNVCFFREYDKVINLVLSNDKNYSAFFDGSFLQVLNHDNRQVKSYPKSIQFAVNDDGNPVFVNETGDVRFQDKTYRFEERVHSVHFIKNIPLVVVQNSIYAISSELELLAAFEEEIFDAKSIERELYFVLQNQSHYQLFKLALSKQIKKISEVFFEKSSHRIEEPIFAPLYYGEEHYPYPIGNSYAEIQEYDGTPYLHPGVDLLGDDFQEVYSVKDGYVKAVLTTGGAPYWRVAIANEDVSTESRGYLYAHLNENSITVNVGDEVQAGELLGTLYPWNYYDFTHIHFAKIFASGAQWNGDWWTTENVLYDMINVQDITPPVFEDAIEGSRFAFRNQSGTYLDWYALSGEFDIIVKCYDLANSEWKIDVHDLHYSLYSFDNPEILLFERFAFAFDFDLDTYHAGVADNLILNTIYSRDTVCYSTGNYEEREYYHLITNSDGESLDASATFDSTQFTDGMYWLKVTARDANLNTAVDSMLVVFENGNTEITENLPLNEISLTNHPNPFNPATTISFQLPEYAQDAVIDIFNVKGQRVRRFSVDYPKEVNIVWDGKDDQKEQVASGIYLYCLHIDNKFKAANKMILMK